jgi:3',5'-nucleoside bisphosphate phosphatase
MFTRGDFHIHSTFSDGELSPRQIVIAARKLGVDTIAIADHNSINGIEEAAVAGRLYGVSIVPAVELSTRYKGESIHLLGYFTDTRFCNRIFVKALSLVENHKVNESRKILCNYIYTENSGNHLSVFEGINFLRAFGAAVVLAHPVRISKRNLSELLCLPFDGIEAKYSSNSHYDTNFFVNLALNRFSFYTAGSDFHSEKKHQIHGSIGQPSLYLAEIDMFLSNSGAAVLR